MEVRCASRIVGERWDSFAVATKFFISELAVQTQKSFPTRVIVSMESNLGEALEQCR